MIELTFPEARVLGCLLEKERTTPEYYPLTLNSLVAACNQSTSRNPVVSFDDRTVSTALDGLREKRLAVMVHAAGSRVPKYRHKILEEYELNAGDVAILCVLLLRGPQTPGELKSRTERMHPFGSLEEVELEIDEMSKGEEPLVAILPPRPGQKEKRFRHCLLPYQEEALDQVSYPSPAAHPAAGPGKMEELEARVKELEQQLTALRAEFSEFRKQYD